MADESASKDGRTNENEVFNLPRVRVKVYDEKEDTTCIEVAVLLKGSKCKKWCITPLVSLLTIGIYPLVLYWNINLQRRMLYEPAFSEQSATHIYVQSRDGNQEIVQVKDYSELSNDLKQMANEVD